MFSELTDAIIAEMDEKYLDLMESMDSDDFLEDLDDEDETIDYQDVLYISMKYCEGVLSQSVYNLGPIMYDHIESADTLVQLHKEGILTVSGQRSVAGKRQRSYIDFSIRFDECEFDYIVELLETLHKRGLNVWGLIKSDTHMQQIALFKAPRDHPNHDLDCYELNSKRLSDRKFNSDMNMLCLVTEPRTRQWPDSPFHDYEHSFFENVEVIVPHEYTLIADVFNIEWDDLQADEILLDAIRELKARQ